MQSSGAISKEFASNGFGEVLSFDATTIGTNPPDSARNPSVLLIALAVSLSLGISLLIAMIVTSVIIYRRRQAALAAPQLKYNETLPIENNGDSLQVIAPN